MALICVSIVHTVSLCGPIVVVFTVAFFVKASALQGMTKGPNKTKEKQDCAAGLEEDPKDVDVIDFHLLRRTLCVPSVVLGLAVVLPCVLLSHSSKFQPPRVGVDAVGGVDELGTGFGVLRKLLVVVEPAVLGGREALVL